MKTLQEYLEEFNLQAELYLKENIQIKFHSFFQEFFKKENLEKAQWPDFQKMGNYIHSFNSLALAKGNALGNPNADIEHYRNVFLSLLYGSNPLKERVGLFFNEKNILPFFGKGAKSEIVAHAFPNDYSMFNERDKFALKLLGIEEDAYMTSNPFTSYLNYLEKVSPIKEKYLEFIGSKSALPINLEIDQFFSYLYEQYGKSDQISYWQIAPGDQAFLWQDCFDRNIIRVGWDNLGDVSELNSKEEIEKKYFLTHPKGNKHSFGMFWRFYNDVKEGDYIIANQGKSKVVGIGIVKDSSYYFDGNLPVYPHYKFVDWDKSIQPFQIPTNNKFGKTIQRLTEDDYIKIISHEDNTVGLSTSQNASSKGDKNKVLYNHVEIKAYSKSEALKDLFISEQDYDEILELLLYKKNIILQGPPGVGKTFIAKRIAYSILGKEDESKIEMIQFHQSYSYEDFIQGFRPNEEGKFDIVNGIFYNFCSKAQRDSSNNYFFIIDEINRGNLSKIFGELMMLIEHDKRGNKFSIPLTYSRSSDEKFFIPENLHIIGTMNTADRSLALVDYALRRRFNFISLKPRFDDKFKKYLQSQNIDDTIISKIIERVNELNKHISNDKKNLGEGFQIGHSFFCTYPLFNGINSVEWYKKIIKTEIAPLLKEYWFDDEDSAQKKIDRLLQ